MTDEIKGYVDVLLLAKAMLAKGIINQKDYDKIDDHFRKKYGIKNNNLYCSIDLLYTRFRGIDRLPKEGIKNDDEKG